MRGLNYVGCELYGKKGECVRVCVFTHTQIEREGNDIQLPIFNLVVIQKLSITCKTALNRM